MGFVSWGEGAQMKGRLIDFYWGKMCMVNENRTNPKIEAFSLEAPRENIGSWGWAECPS